MSHVVDVADATFQQEVLDADKPVLVDFWAPWCGPCKAMAPALDSVAAEFAGKAKVVKVNIDDNTDAASQFSVSSIPTLMVFKNGQPVATKVGMQNQAALADMINAVL